MLFDVAGDVSVGSEPHPRAGTHMLHQLIEDAHARAMPDDVGVHGEQEEPALDVGPVEFAAPDFPDQ